MIHCGIIMAGQNCTQTAGLFHGACLVLCAEAALQTQQVLNMFAKLRVTHPAFLGDIGLQRGQVTELTLARGMIHKADDADPI